jgi:Tfp pilus assembly pilus retraction ATPase PilT
MLKASGPAPIYLIIDALDECPNTTKLPPPREKMLELIEKLVKLNLPNLHLCVTSRPEFDIRGSLEPLTTKCISLHDQSGQKKDIEDYVRSVVSSDRNMMRWRDEDKTLVIETLTKKADGM